MSCLRTLYSGSKSLVNRPTACGQRRGPKTWTAVGEGEEVAATRAGVNNAGQLDEVIQELPCPPAGSRQKFVSIYSVCARATERSSLTFLYSSLRSYLLQEKGDLCSTNLQKAIRSLGIRSRRLLHRARSDGFRQWTSKGVPTWPPTASFQLFRGIRLYCLLLVKD